jgi:hypothetical protein
MNTPTQYRINQLGRKLKEGTAWIEGRTCDGDRWPEGRHYYICIDGMNTYHVACDTRPSWGKYIKA